MTENEILKRFDNIALLNKIKKACVAAMWLGVLVEVIFCRGGIVVSENGSIWPWTCGFALVVVSMLSFTVISVVAWWKHQKLQQDTEKVVDGES